MASVRGVRNGRTWGVVEPQASDSRAVEGAKKRGLARARYVKGVKIPLQKEIATRGKQMDRGLDLYTASSFQLAANTLGRISSGKSSFQVPQVWSGPHLQLPFDVAVSKK